METSFVHTQPVISTCSEEQFAVVKEHIRLLELDDRQLERGQFLVIAEQDELLAFCRMREYNGSREMCSLGVLEKARGRGLGRQLVQSLIKKGTGPVYIVCIIPSYFAPHGFTECHEYPEEIAAKLKYCTQDLPVEEKYVVLIRP